MRAIGVLATALAAALTGGLALLVVRSVPDLRRYLKIRSM